MVLTYGVSVILISFAIFGLWCFCKDMWSWFVAPYIGTVPSISFIIVVKNIEQDIEEMLRHLMLEIEDADLMCDVIVLDCNSEDLTYPIIERLSREFDQITALHSSKLAIAVEDALPYCTGNIVHVIDTVNKIDIVHFLTIICWLVKQASEKIVMPKHDM
ncbi:glycosyltransferase [Anaerosinus massiliensis]|uniref:glycosyltransferase n=1 Tax=Massilibacillus massiliensis TaxID=1806837 RepID=UPI000DA60A24|nr:glycosyltransferase [Massilibacillus massiliensis]